MILCVLKDIRVGGENVDKSGYGQIGLTWSAEKSKNHRRL
jgi:hypothetical protein